MHSRFSSKSRIYMLHYFLFMVFIKSAFLASDIVSSITTITVANRRSVALQLCCMRQQRLQCPASFIQTVWKPNNVIKLWMYDIGYFVLTISAFLSFCMTLFLLFCIVFSHGPANILHWGHFY